MSLQPGHILANKYRIEAEIGKGSFGRVYRAVDIKLNRVVAIKELLKRGGDVGSSDYIKFVGRFRREAELQASFNNPHIVRVYELLELPPDQETPEQLYLVMEYVDGGSLYDLLKKKGTLPLPQSAEITTQLLAALAHVHTDPRDLVHRDIKPKNILLTQKEEVKLSDFGLAQIGDESTRSMSGTRGQPGTPLYMSPEQERGMPYLYPASDLFSVGCVLFEMVTGYIYKQAYRDKEQLDSLWAGIPPHLRQVVQKSLYKEWEERFTQADAFSKALNRSPSHATKRIVGLILLILLLVAGVWGAVGANNNNGIVAVEDSSPMPTAVTPTLDETPTPTRPTTPLPRTIASRTATATPTRTPTATRTPPTTVTRSAVTQTATNTPMANMPASSTNTPVPPTATNTPVPPSTATNTPVPPPTATNTPVPPPTATNTPVPLPTATNTPSAGATRPPTPTP